MISHVSSWAFGETSQHQTEVLGQNVCKSVVHKTHYKPLSKSDAGICQSFQTLKVKKVRETPMDEMLIGPLSRKRWIPHFVAGPANGRGSSRHQEAGSNTINGYQWISMDINGYQCREHIAARERIAKDSKRSI